MKRPNLTEAELRLMEVIWTLGHATVADVADALPPDLQRDSPLAYNTVLTTMRILEDKGFLRHTKAKEGRAFIYRPAVTRESASRNAVRHLLRRFFGDSPEALVMNLLENEKIDDQEMQRIRETLKRKGGSKK
jgi:predicted transcriptional regulator